MRFLRTERHIIKQFIRRHKKYSKTKSSGRDLVIYCGHTKHQWNAKLFNEKGSAGSEEAVIFLAKELATIGWDVTVYNNCGHKPIVDAGVLYRPSWDFSPRDKQDVVILWRTTKPVDWDINAKRIFVDLHDTTDERAFTKRNRITKISRIFVKSQFHRSLYPTLPDHKIAIIPNGIDLTLLEGSEQKDPYLLINTSSADRSLNILPTLFREVKRRVPQVRLQWAYGWDLFELFNAHRPHQIQWMKQTQRDMENAGIESLGHLTQTDVGKLYQRGAILAYPTDFAEIDCISVRKAQACGCVPVTTDFGALAETVRFGVKVPIPTRDIWNHGHRLHFGIEDKEAQRLWVDATVDLLTNPAKRAALAIQGANWAREFAWPRIAKRWTEILCGEHSVEARTARQ